MSNEQSKKELIRKMDEQLKDSKLTEEDALAIGRKITKKAAIRFNKTKTSKTDKKSVDKIIESIKKLDGPTLKQIWLSLDKKLSYSEILIIIKDLEKSGKIIIDKSGRIIWTWNPNMIKKIKDSKVKLR